MDKAFNINSCVWQIGLQEEKKNARFGVVTKDVINVQGDFKCAFDNVNIYRHYYPKLKNNEHSISIIKILEYCISKIPAITLEDLTFCLEQLKAVEKQLRDFSLIYRVNVTDIPDKVDISSGYSLWEHYLYVDKKNIESSEAKYLSLALDYQNLKSLFEPTAQLLQTKYKIAFTQTLAKLGASEISLNWIDDTVLKNLIEKEYIEHILLDNKYFSKQAISLNNTDINTLFIDLFGKPLDGFKPEQTFFVPLSLHCPDKSKAAVFEIKGTMGKTFRQASLSEQPLFMEMGPCLEFLDNLHTNGRKEFIIIKIENSIIKEIIMAKNTSEEFLPEIEKMQILLEKERVNNHLGEVGMENVASNIGKKMVGKI